MSDLIAFLEALTGEEPKSSCPFCARSHAARSNG
jgi:hypothetical protein